MDDERNVFYNPPFIKRKALDLLTRGFSYIWFSTSLHQTLESSDPWGLELKLQLVA